MYISENYVNGHVCNEGAVSKIVKWLRGGVIVNDESREEFSRDQSKYDKHKKEWDKCRAKASPEGYVLCYDAFLRKVRQTAQSTNVCSKLSDKNSKIKCNANVASYIQYIDAELKKCKLKLNKLRKGKK